MMLERQGIQMVIMMMEYLEIHRLHRLVLERLQVPPMGIPSPWIKTVMALKIIKSQTMTQRFSEDLTMDMTKVAQTIDVNSDGVLGVGDKILYTVVVTNTGSISYTLQLTDVLTNEASQTIESLDLEFVGLSTPTLYNVPKNFLKRSAGFNYNSFNGYWRKDHSGDNTGVRFHQSLGTQPAEAYVYLVLALELRRLKQD